MATSNDIAESDAASNDPVNAGFGNLRQRGNLPTSFRLGILSAKHRKRDGIALLWVIIFLGLIIALVGLSLDTGQDMLTIFPCYSHCMK